MSSTPQPSTRVRAGRKGSECRDSWQLHFPIPIASQRGAGGALE
jgi:hypothetical protein